MKGLDGAARPGPDSEDGSIKSSSSWQGEQAKPPPPQLTAAVLLTTSADTIGLNIIGQGTDYIYSWATIHQEGKWSHESLHSAIL